MTRQVSNGNGIRAGTVINTWTHKTLTKALAGGDPEAEERMQKLSHGTF